MHFPQTFGSKLHKSGTFPMRKYGGKRGKKARNVGQSYTLHLILHPNLHPKLPEFIRVFHTGCRKCRRFSKTFFWGGRGRMSKRLLHEGGREFQNIGLLCIKHPYFWGKTSVLLHKEVRCFWFPEKDSFLSEWLSHIVVVSFCGVPATSRQKVARRR